MNKNKERKRNLRAEVNSMLYTLKKKNIASVDIYVDMKENELTSIRLEETTAKKINEDSVYKTLGEKHSINLLLTVVRDYNSPKNCSSLFIIKSLHVF